MSQFEIEIPAELMKRLEGLPNRPGEHPYKRVALEVLKKYGGKKGWKGIAKVLQEYYNYPIKPETLRKWYEREVKHDTEAI
jgi:phage-related holin